MLYAIAEIYDRERLYGYRVLNSISGDVHEYTDNHLAKLINDKSLEIKNMSTDGDKAVIVGEYSNKYPRIGIESKLDRKTAIIVLERLSLIDYKCTNYTGKIFNMTLNNLTYNSGIAIIVNGYIKNSEIIMEQTYDIDLEKVKTLDYKIKGYEDKSKILGNIPLGIEIKGNEAVITSVDPEIKDVIIPSFVTAIWQRAFNHNNIISYIHIPTGVKFIGRSAFSYCNELTEVIMEDTDIILDRGVFASCTNLRYIQLSKKLIEVPDNTFRFCRNLVKVEIPQSVKILGKESFAFCRKINNIKFNGQLDSIGRNAFEKCISLGNIELPYVKHTGDGIFSSCKGLTSIKITGIDTINMNMFIYCESIKTIVIPEGVKKIHDLAFSNCIKLETVELPSTIENIATNAFIDIEHEVDIIVNKESYFGEVENAKFIYR